MDEAGGLGYSTEGREESDTTEATWQTCMYAFSKCWQLVLKILYT